MSPDVFHDEKADGRPRLLRTRVADSTEIVHGDILNRESVSTAMQGVGIGEEERRDAMYARGPSLTEFQGSVEKHGPADT